jgi:deoxycytidine triphosphate deaminase
MATGGFWTSEKLKERLPKIVVPYDKEAVMSCCYELCVGGEGFVSGDGTHKRLLKEGESIAIPPGQVALVITKETLTTPLDALGFLSLKSGIKLRGLINVSGFHVDPGFEGKLVFSMYNAGTQTIHLSFGSRLFLIWFCTLDGSTRDQYHGVHNHHIQQLRLEFGSLEAKYVLDIKSLETKYTLDIKSLETKYALDSKNAELTYTSYFRNLDYTFKTVIALVFLILGIFIKDMIGVKAQSSQSATSQSASQPSSPATSTGPIMNFTQPTIIPSPSPPSQTIPPPHLGGPQSPGP